MKIDKSFKKDKNNHFRAKLLTKTSGIFGFLKDFN